MAFPTTDIVVSTAGYTPGTALSVSADDGRGDGATTPYTPSAGLVVAATGYVPSVSVEFAAGATPPATPSAYAPSVHIAIAKSGYTPSTAIQLATGAVPEPTTSAAFSFSQQWARELGVVVTFGERVAAHTWSIVDAEFPPGLRWVQQWAQQAGDFSDQHRAQQWALAGYTRLDAAWAQQWAVQARAVWSPVVSATAYRFRLEQPGLGATTIPIAAFSGQLRSGQPSYLQVSIPDAPRWAATLAAYAAQADTDMVIHAGYRYSDGAYQTVEIARVTLRNVRSDYGAKSSTISLDGIDTRSNTAPKSVALTGASYRSVADSGRVRYRCAMNFSVRPGDTVTVAGETFVVGELSYQVSAGAATLEVAEAV
jgi:hypothetical protein